MTTEELYQRRIDDIIKTVNHQNPAYVPLMVNGAPGLLGYAGVTLRDAMADPEVYANGVTKIFDEMYADCTIPLGAFVFPELNNALGGNAQLQMAPDGTSVLHIARPQMKEDEYPLLAKDPAAFLKNVILPRLYPSLFEGGISAAKDTIKTILNEMGYIFFGLNAAASLISREKYGIVDIDDETFQLVNPLDLIFDYFRGFKDTTIDIRRRKSEVKDACDALWATHTNHFDELASTFPFAPQMPHIPTYISPKVFEELYWPYEKQMIENIHKNGGKAMIFMEGAWMQLLDFFKDVPKESCILLMDNDDIFEVKKKIGDWHAIGGGANIFRTKFASKQENIEHTKRVIDECAPGAGFIFITDKNLNCPSDISQNLIDVYNFAHEYGRY